MPRLPKITVQGWTSDGPAYTIHHPLSGWRNRRNRRAGTGGEEQVGDHDGLNDKLDLETPAAYMVFAKADREVYAFKGGHVYQVTLLVDGDALDVLVDAREGDRLETYGDDLQLLEYRALEGDELEAALADGPAQTEYVGDPSESQDPAPVDETAATAARLEAALTPGTPEHEGVITSLTGAQTEPAAEVDVPEPPVELAPTSELEPAAPTELEPAPADESTPEHEDEDSDSEDNFDGTVAEFVELAEVMDFEELEAYRERDSRKGVREAAAAEILERQSAEDSADDEE